MTDICETNQPVQGSQHHQHADITWIFMNREAAKRGVKKLQQQIFQATRDKNFYTARRLKKLLFKSLNARFLAVLTVTSNQGRYTPDVDGIIFKTPEEKWDLVEDLRNIKEYQPKPVRLVYIPKRNGKKRKLGIPTIKDRAMQMLVYITMIPEWEARFEPHSFGFRPGRSPIDAVHYIGGNFVPKKGKRPHPGWVLDADISACFDNINHSALLRKLRYEPQIGLIKRWLKAGSISKIGFSSTNKGTPQGGPISPLLANIALDGMERIFGIYNKYGRYVNPSQRRGSNKQLTVYRYADDFIVTALSKEILEDYALPKLKEFLESLSLSLNHAKTKIINVSEGFDFLGFHFHRFHRRDGSVKQFIYAPCRDRLDSFLRKLKIWLRKSQHLAVEEIITGLNRKIKGFCN
ncbi:MAG: group II intron reverse transcriptase/maturase [Candidatus Lokiarchaeota archaeon]|nr:group II intron reverse transcriptase/maturase [Candidatus Harpocratesius repetitus]